MRFGPVEEDSAATMERRDGSDDLHRLDLRSSKPLAAALKAAHPLMLRAIAAAKKKNDRIDANKICDCLRCDVGNYWFELDRLFFNEVPQINSLRNRTRPEHSSYQLLLPLAGGFLSFRGVQQLFHGPSDVRFDGTRQLLLARDVIIKFRQSRNNTVYQNLNARMVLRAFQFVFDGRHYCTTSLMA